MPDWWKAVLSDMNKRKWADPVWRAQELKRRADHSRAIATPEVFEARRRRRNHYHKLRKAGLSREAILKELGE
jgi:hypothetical protein